jgi:hypothetical protein
MKPHIGIAHHTSAKRGTYRSDHGTPLWVIYSALEALSKRSVWLDLASSAGDNRRICARHFYSPEKPCPETPHVAAGEFVWCNPPGPYKVHGKFFWNVWCGCIRRGAVGAYLIYNLDHWRHLMPPSFEASVIVLAKRLRFEGNKHQANFPSALVLSGAPHGPPKLGGQYVTWGV